jgi:hypothetical protein
LAGVLLHQPFGDFVRFREESKPPPESLPDQNDLTGMLTGASIQTIWMVSLTARKADFLIEDKGLF